MEDPFVETRQPESRFCTVAGDEVTHEIDIGASSRDHGELGIKALEIELADDALMPLLDEEASRAGLELILEEPELPLGESEATAVVLEVGVGIRKEHLGRVSAQRWCG